MSNNLEIFKAFSQIELDVEKLDEYFANVVLCWDSCDCSYMSCSHPDIVYEIVVSKDGIKSLDIQIEDGETLFGQGYSSHFAIPVTCTLYDFYRVCQLIDYELELTDYSNKIIKGDL